VARLPGVASVSHWRTSSAKVAGAAAKAAVTGLDPRTTPGAIALDWAKGSAATLAKLKPGEAVIDTKYGDRHNLSVGDRMRLTTPTGKRISVRIVGEVKDRANFLGDIVMPLSQLKRDFDERQDAIAIVKLQPGASPPAVNRRITAVLDSQFPVVDSLNQRQLKDRQSRSFDQLLGLIYALLSLAVIVSIFGIVNTLVLTIHERTRELGLLRAVGMSRRQVRALVRYESVVTALIGAILGAVLGVFFAVVVSRPIADEGFVLTVPIGSIVAFLVLAAIAGVLAAIPPARRAARLDVLEALAYE
jgi:putative ABC transport system permease protein